MLAVHCLTDDGVNCLITLCHGLVVDDGGAEAHLMAIVTRCTTNTAKPIGREAGTCNCKTTIR